MKKLKFYNENPEAEHTKRWQLFMRLMPSKFVEKFNIENIPTDKKLVPANTNLRLCSRMSKLNVDCVFALNEDCNLAIETLKTFDDQELCDQLSLIFDKFHNTQELLYWPYETEDKTITNMNVIDLIPEYGKPIERVRKTMFVTPASLYWFVANVEQKYDIFVVQHFPSKEVSCTFDGKTVIYYKFNENHGQSEREFFMEVVEKWHQLRPEKIVFKSVLFLTHFSASVLRIIASFYKFTSFNLKGFIELEHLKNNLDSKYIESFLKELSGDSCHYIMCFTELKHVNKGEYFEIITNYNSQLLMKYIIKAFDYLIGNCC